MVIRQSDIIWLGIDIIAIGRLMSSHGHPVAAVPVPCTVYLKTLSELMLCHEGKLMTVVVPVAIPCMEEILEISLVPRKGIIHIRFCPSVVISEIEFRTP